MLYYYYICFLITEVGCARYRGVDMNTYIAVVQVMRTHIAGHIYNEDTYIAVIELMYRGVKTVDTPAHERQREAPGTSPIKKI